MDEYADQDGAGAVLPDLVGQPGQAGVKLPGPVARLVLVAVRRAGSGVDVPAVILQPGAAPLLSAGWLPLAELCLQAVTVAEDIEDFAPRVPDFDRLASRAARPPGRNRPGPLPAAQADHMSVGQVPGPHQHHAARARDPGRGVSR